MSASTPQALGTIESDVLEALRKLSDAYQHDWWPAPFLAECCDLYPLQRFELASAQVHATLAAAAAHMAAAEQIGVDSEPAR